MTIESWEECAVRLQSAADELSKYHNDKIKLKFTQARDLERRFYILTEELITHCPHDMVRVYRGTYTDVGYGMDKYYDNYDLVCERCQSVLINNSCDDKRRAIHPDTKTILEGILILKQKDRVSEDQLRKYGISLSTHTTQTTKVWVNGVLYDA